MKLYTEDVIIKRLLSLNVTNTDIFIDSLTPIELPSDEEIEKYFKWGYGGDSGSAIYGAKWVKKQILNQNK